MASLYIVKITPLTAASLLSLRLDHTDIGFAAEETLLGATHKGPRLAVIPRSLTHLKGVGGWTTIRIYTEFLQQELHIHAANTRADTLVTADSPHSGGLSLRTQSERRETTCVRDPGSHHIQDIHPRTVAHTHRYISSVLTSLQAMALSTTISPRSLQPPRPCKYCGTDTHFKFKRPTSLGPSELQTNTNFWFIPDQTHTSTLHTPALPCRE